MRNNVLHPADYLDVSSADAARLGLNDGECVRVRSRYGDALLPLRISEAVVPGRLFATFHTAEAFLNHVTGPHRTKFVGAPARSVVRY